MGIAIFWGVTPILKRLIAIIVVRKSALKETFETFPKIHQFWFWKGFQYPISIFECNCALYPWLTWQNISINWHHIPGIAPKTWYLHRKQFDPSLNEFTFGWVFPRINFAPPPFQNLTNSPNTKYHPKKVRLKTFRTNHWWLEKGVFLLCRCCCKL